MSAIVIEHVKVGDLPEDWRERLHAAVDALVTVRIEEESLVSQATKEDADNPLFGMWRDREDMVDVVAYLRKVRAPRF